MVLELWVPSAFLVYPCQASSLGIVFLVALHCWWQSISFHVFPFLFSLSFESQPALWENVIFPLPQCLWWITSHPFSKYCSQLNEPQHSWRSPKFSEFFKTQWPQLPVMVSTSAILKEKRNMFIGLVPSEDNSSLVWDQED